MSQIKESEHHTNKPSEKTILGHPAGVFLVSGTEMWERFSYYGLGAILVLFLTAPVATGGFAWNKTEAVQLYGLYTGLAFSLPAIGGWIASRYIGERRAIVVGGLTITFGHFLMGAPGFGPWLIDYFAGLPADHIIDVAGVEVGSATYSEGIAAGLHQAALSLGITLTEKQSFLLSLAYLSKGWGLYLGLAAIIIGTAFLKGPISAIVGQLYSDNDSRKEAGYTIFMVGIWAGAMLAELVVGVVGEYVSWHMGLALAGVGMAGGLTNYLLRQNALLGGIGKKAGEDQEDTKFYLEDHEKSPLKALAVMAVFTMLFSIAYNQYGGVLNLMIYEHVDRTVGSFVVPAAWFLIVNTLSFIILAPLMTRFYDWLETKNIRIDVVQKQALGLLSIGIAYGMLMVPSFQHEANPEALLNPVWIIAAYLLFALGDVFIWPPQITAISDLAPKRYHSFIMGVWYVTYGLGGVIAGFVAPIAYSQGFVVFTGGILGISLLCSVLLLCLRRYILRQAYGR